MPCCALSSAHIKIRKEHARGVRVVFLNGAWSSCHLRVVCRHRIVRTVCSVPFPFVSGRSVSHLFLRWCCCCRRENTRTPRAQRAVAVSTMPRTVFASKQHQSALTATKFAESAVADYAEYAVKPTQTAAGNPLHCSASAMVVLSL